MIFFLKKILLIVDLVLNHGISPVTVFKNSKALDFMNKPDDRA